MVRADTTYEDSYMPTVVISPSVSARLTGSNAGIYLSYTLNDGLCITVVYSVSLEIQIICFLKHEARSGSVFRLPAESVTEDRCVVNQTPEHD